MSMLEQFRTGGITMSERKAAIIAFAITKLVLSTAMLWLASWLLSWHFARCMGLFFIVCAAHVAYMKVGPRTADIYEAMRRGRYGAT